MTSSVTPTRQSPSENRSALKEQNLLHWEQILIFGLDRFSEGRQNTLGSFIAPKNVSCPLK